MSATRVKVSGWRRHLEGWPAGLIAVSLAAVGVLLGSPHPVMPEEVPLPVVDPGGLAASAALDRQRAASMVARSDTEKSGVGFEVRQLGAKLREYNEADAADDKDRIAALHGELLRATYNLTQQGGAEALLQLRAYQLRVFLRELASWEATKVESAELRQVGGAITRLIGESAWRRPDGHFMADDGARVALFKRRFAEVLGASSRPELAITVDEARALYTFFLEHPPDASTAWVFRLRKVEELAALDPSYPRQLARGVALLRLGQGAAAVVELREHLTRHPDGPYTLRARNYLTAAVETAEQQGGGL